MPYSDIMNMPTYERRFYLGMLTNSIKEKKETNVVNTTGKGKRQTRISGAQLKNRMKNGDIPLK